MQDHHSQFFRRGVAIATLALSVSAFAPFASAQHPEGAAMQRSTQQEVNPRGMQAGHIYMPESSIERPEDLGLRAHTNYVMRSEDGSKPQGLLAPRSLQTFGPDSVIEEPETPASMGCLYVQSPNNVKTGCVPNSDSGTKGPSSAGWGAIALVDAYDNPDAATDLKTFDSYWGLPKANFVKIYANGNGDCTTPAASAGWSGEESLDIEWAHVFAPKAVIVLVEACSNSYNDLFYAETVAISYIQNNYGGGAVSNSWAGGEFSGESSYDFDFAAAGVNPYVPVAVFASAGDSGYGALYPSSNPWLTSAGGTSVYRNSNGTFSSEGCWSGSGGGVSAYETTGQSTEYQYAIFGGGAARMTPDLAFNADPASGVWVYSEYGFGGWTPVGGTSVASPSLAGIVNRAGNQLSTWYGYYANNGYGFYLNEENDLLYSQLPTSKAYYTNFYDITSGSNGGTVTNNWDYCTGVGSPRGLLGK